MERPHILLVPQLTEMEWERTRPLIEDWAEVASFDTPGVGTEPRRRTAGRAASAERGLEELAARGWDQFFLVADSWAGPTAASIAAARPEAVAGIALGHPALRYPSINTSLYEAVGRLIDADYRAFVTGGIAQLTQDSYDRDWVDRMVERIPVAAAREFFVNTQKQELELEPILTRLGKPLLLAEHQGCIAVEHEVFEAVVAAFPEAATIAMKRAPATDPVFAEALRDFVLTGTGARP